MNPLQARIDAFQRFGGQVLLVEPGAFRPGDLHPSFAKDAVITLREGESVEVDDDLLIVCARQTK